MLVDFEQQSCDLCPCIRKQGIFLVGRPVVGNEKKTGTN